MSHKTKNKPAAIAAKRALEPVNDASGHVREVIGNLSDLVFTQEELVEVFRFSAADVADCLDEP